MQSRIHFTVMVVMLACATKIASDIYTPSVLVMAQQIPGASVDSIQLSFPIFLFGVAITQLFYGPLSEGIGRKRPVLLGLMIMAIGSLLCATATSISTLLIGRSVQGCGAGALYALWRAILRDVSYGENLARRSMPLFVIMAGCGSLAPIFGGYLVTINWRCNFWFMVAYILTTIILVWCGYQESNTHSHSDRLHWSYVQATYFRLLIDPIFMGLSICMLLSFSSIFVWLMVAPVLLMQKCHLSPTWFGWLVAASTTTGFAIGALLNNRYVRHVGMSTMMMLGWAIMWGAGIAIYCGFYLVGVTTLAIMLPMVVFYVGSTMIWPNAFAIAFTPYGDIAGYAASLYGVIQLGGGALISAVISQFPDVDQRPLGIVIIVAVSGALWLYQQWICPAIKRHPAYASESDCQNQ